MQRLTAATPQLMLVLYAFTIAAEFPPGVAWWTESRLNISRHSGRFPQPGRRYIRL